MPQDRTLVQTESGPVRGEMTDGVLRFLGIPYAAAPWDELRFKAPQPVQWTEVRAATAYGATVRSCRIRGSSVNCCRPARFGVQKF